MSYDPSSDVYVYNPSSSYDSSAADYANVKANLDIVSTMLTPIFNEASQKRMMDYQDKIRKKWWNIETAYNSPAAQRRRLESAGLNYALMQGGSGTGATIQTGQGRAAAPGSIPSSLPFGNIASQMAEIGLMRSQAAKNEADARKSDADTENVGEDTVTKKFYNQNIAPLVAKGYDLSNSNQEWQNLMSQINAEWLEIEKINNAGEALTRIAELNSRIKKNLSDANLNDKQREWYDHYNKQTDALTDKYRAEIKNIEADTQTKNESRRFYIHFLDERATKEAAERYGINLDNELKEHNLPFDKAERIIDNNWYEVNQWIKAGKDISELVDNLASAYNQFTQPGDRDADRESREKDNRKNRNSTRDNAFLKAALMLLIKKL